MNADTRLERLEAAARLVIAQRRRELAEMTPEQYAAEVGTLSDEDFDTLKRSLWTPAWSATLEAMSEEELAEVAAGGWPAHIARPPSDGVPFLPPRNQVAT